MTNKFTKHPVIQQAKDQIKERIGQKHEAVSVIVGQQTAKKVLMNLAREEIGSSEYQNQAKLVRENIALKKGKQLPQEKIVKKESQESKESSESLMGWEKETFKIDSTGWKETTKSNYNGNAIKVKESPKGNVFEYLDGPAKGEQIFVNYENFLKYVAKVKGCTLEEAEKRYVMTKKQFEKKIKQIEASEGGYKAFFNKEIAGHLAGYWTPNNKKFINVGVGSNVWLAGGYGADFTRDRWDRNSSYDDHGFSGRLLKN